VKLIKARKKKYYENMTDHNKGNSIAMSKILKEIIKGESNGNKKTKDINFEFR